MVALAYYVVSKEIQNRIFRHIRIFLDTHVCINLFRQSSGIIIFLRKNYIVI